MPDSDLLSQEQIARLREAQQMAQEAELLAARRRLVAELRSRHYEGRWFKPLDLWSRGGQILAAALLIAIAFLVAVAAQAWWLAQQFEPRIQPSTEEIRQSQQAAFAHVSSPASDALEEQREFVRKLLIIDEWTETFGSERLTGALLDRLTHHVSILEMSGESYRLGQSQARKARPSP